MFTPYYILAVGFGAFAVIVSLIGMKNPESFPGKFSGLVMLIGALIGIATFVFVWRGGEDELDHKKAEEAHQAAETSSTSTLPSGVRPTS
jgi:hypothetical protein